MAKRLVTLFAVLFLLCVGLGYSADRTYFGDIAAWTVLRGREAENIRRTIVLYNKILTDLYDSNGAPLLLDEFPATKSLKHELYQTLGFLRGQDLIQVYDIADITFLDVKMPSPWMAEVTAFEEWNYLYQKTETRETARSIKGMGQGFKYTLVKNNGKWIIADYAPADVTPEKKKDEFYY